MNLLLNHIGNTTFWLDTLTLAPRFLPNFINFLKKKHLDTLEKIAVSMIRFSH